MSSSCAVHGTRPSEVHDDAVLINIGQAAKLCGLGEKSVRKLYGTGRFPMPMKLGRATRWDKRVVMRWIDAGCPPMSKFRR